MLALMKTFIYYADYPCKTPMLLLNCIYVQFINEMNHRHTRGLVILNSDTDIN